MLPSCPSREDYESEISTMQRHLWFLRDTDDDFDCTYADFWFRPPMPELDPEIVDVLLKLAVEPVDMGAR